MNTAPTRSLQNGGSIPAIGLGTFGSDKYSPAQVAAAVAYGLRAGCRLFDCASVYGNEDSIGAVFEEAFREGVCRREELFVISKVWNDSHGQGEVLLSLAKSLRDLRLDYVDAFFVHWPFPNYHSPGCGGDARNPDSKPFSAEQYISVWRQMERAQRMGLTKHLGMSNMTVSKLEAVLPLCEAQPALIEMELHPCFQQSELFTYCLGKSIQPLAFCPIGSPSRPARDRTAADVSDTELPEIVEIAKRHGVHPAVICLKWLTQIGAVPIPFSATPAKIEANLRAVREDPLTEAEMAVMASTERGCRLIKGQVFLWEGASDWTEIWQ